jgi:hypothetical protein
MMYVKFWKYPVLFSLQLVGLKLAHLQYGWTPLHLAVQAQRTDMVKLLLIKGADRTLQNQVSNVNSP